MPWYNSGLSQGLGAAAVILALGFGGGAFIKGCREGISNVPANRAVEIEKVRHQYKLQTADLNGATYDFYVIDKKIAVVNINGKPVVNSLDAKVLEK